MMAPKITCGMCRREYTADESRIVCSNCAMIGAGGCQKVRCPHCGYEQPAPARLPSLLKSLVSKLTGGKK